MRSFAGVTGDTTAAAKAWLLSHQTLYLTNVIQIAVAGNGGLTLPGYGYLTTWDTPLELDLPLNWGGSPWNASGMYVPWPIEVDKFDSKIGLETTTCTLKLGQVDAPYFTDGGKVLTLKQTVEMGVLDQELVRIFRVVMPTPGDANTLGSTEMFRGIIGDIQIGRDHIELAVNSMMDFLNRQIPRASIESDNLNGLITPIMSAAPWCIPAPAPASNLPCRGLIAAGSTENVLLVDLASPSAGAQVPNGLLKLGAIDLSHAGDYIAQYELIHDNEWDSVAGHNVIYLTRPLWYAPPVGATVYLYRQTPKTRADCEQDINWGGPDGTSKYAGFPYVPQPESSI